MLLIMTPLLACRSNLSSSLARLVALFACLISPAALHADEPHRDRPNIVIFLVDDMGIMDTSVPFFTDDSGAPRRYPLNDFYRTPSMERLASRGIRFNQFCAMSVCSPTRVSIMTGQNPARHRTTNWINPDSNNAGKFGPRDWNWRGLTSGDVTLARLMQAQGYRTIHVGKGHFGPRDSEGADPTQLGFDINVGGSSISQPGSYYGQQHYGALAKRKTHAVPHLEKYHGTETFLTDALTLEAGSHVSDAVKSKQPFFLYLAHYAVHAPFHSDPRFASHYAAEAKKADTAAKSAPAQSFATLIEGMDKSLGDLMDHLEQLGVAENTLILMLGDNGTDAPLGNEHQVACAAPLRGKKGAHYEGGMRVPFIAAWAKPDASVVAQQRLPIAVSAVQSQQAAVIDLMPTLLDVAGIEIPAGHRVDGQKLNRLLSGQSDEARGERFLMHYPHGPHRSSHWSSLRDGDWKVIYHYLPSEVSNHSRYQLFHLDDDPFEQNELSESKPEELRRMMQILVATLKDHEALYPIDSNGKPLIPVIP